MTSSKLQFVLGALGLEVKPIDKSEVITRQKAALEAVSRYLALSGGDTFSFRSIYRTLFLHEKLVPGFSQHDFTALAKVGIFAEVPERHSNQHKVYRMA